MPKSEDQELCEKSGGAWSDALQKCLPPRKLPTEILLYQGPCEGTLVVRVFRKPRLAVDRPTGAGVAVAVADADFQLLKGPLMKALRQGKQKIAAQRRKALDKQKDAGKGKRPSPRPKRKKK